MRGIFSGVCWPSVCLLWRNVCSGLLPTFWLGCLFFWYCTAWVACIFWRSILRQLFHWQLVLNEVNEPRAYYIGWSKSERETQILHINAGIWNLERWYWWFYLQGSNGDRDTENRLWTQWGKERVAQIERTAWKHILPYVKQTASGHLLCDTGSSTQCFVTT